MKRLKATINIDNAKLILFYISFALSCLTMNSDKLNGYCKAQGNVFIFFRYAMIFLFVFTGIIINKKQIEKIIKFIPIATIISTVILIFDYYVTQISGSQFLYRVWWIGSIFVASAGVFLATTIILKGEKYERFFKSFWIGFSPIYLFLLFLCFARKPSNDLSINLEIGQGTFLMLKAFLHNIHISFEAPLIFFGNLLVFIPLPFIIKAFFGKAKLGFILPIGLILPILIESYQYVFKCGHVDVDDVILNQLGFLIGFALLWIIRKNRLKNNNK